MDLSNFGQRLANDAAIFDLMDDLGAALNQNPNLLFLGGGNPAQIPEAQEIFQQHFSALAKDRDKLNAMLGVYQSPQGNEACIEALAHYLAEEFQWPVKPGNIALVNGSQTAFFILLNLWSGPGQAGTHGRIHLPLVPEYLGYAAQTLSEDAFVATRPQIELKGAHGFKYHIDFDALSFDERSAAVCVSRPTNPSANIVGEQELEQLKRLADEQGIPLIVDAAYGLPMPGIYYSSNQSSLPSKIRAWQQGEVWVMSLSKLGLPGVRTGIVVADESIVQQVARANTVLSLAGGNLGPSLLESLIKTGDLKRLSLNILPSYYARQRQIMLEAIDRHLKGLPYRVHDAEGAFFVWLWFEGLPVSSQALYSNLKQEGVLIMGGEHFFFGLEQCWDHARQCIRLSYCQSAEVIDKAVAVLGRQLRQLYL